MAIAGRKKSIQRAGGTHPQRRGQDAVVVISAHEYRRMSAAPSLLDTLLNAPRGAALELERSREPVRGIEL